MFENDFKNEDEKKPGVEDHCHLTGKFKGVAHDKCNLTTQKKFVSFVPFFFKNSSGFSCHQVCENLVAIAVEKGTKKKDKTIARPSEIYRSVKLGCLKTIIFFRFMRDVLDELSRTITSFPTVDANAMENELVKKN